MVLFSGTIIVILLPLGYVVWQRRRSSAPLYSVPAQGVVARAWAARTAVLAGPAAAFPTAGVTRADPAATQVDPAATIPAGWGFTDGCATANTAGFALPPPPNQPNCEPNTTASTNVTTMAAASMMTFEFVLNQETSLCFLTTPPNSGDPTAMVGVCNSSSRVWERRGSFLRGRDSLPPVSLFRPSENLHRRTRCGRTSAKQPAVCHNLRQNATPAESAGNRGGKPTTADGTAAAAGLAL